MTTTNETTTPRFTRDDALKAMLAVGIEFSLPKGDDEGWIMFPPYLRYVDYLNHCEMDPRLMLYSTTPEGFGIGTAEHDKSFPLVAYQEPEMMVFDMLRFMTHHYFRQLDPHFDQSEDYERLTWHTFERVTNYKEEMYR